MLIQFTEELGGRLAMMVQNIKAFRENKDTMAKLHRGAKCIIETVYGDMYYIQDSYEDVLNTLQEVYAQQSKQMDM